MGNTCIMSGVGAPAHMLMSDTDAHTHVGGSSATHKYGSDTNLTYTHAVDTNVTIGYSAAENNNKVDTCNIAGVVTPHKSAGDTGATHAPAGGTSVTCTIADDCRVTDMCVGDAATISAPLGDVDAVHMRASETGAHNMFEELYNFRDKHKSNFIMAHLNVNSFRHKYAYLHEVLARNAADYFAFSETKLDSSFPNAQFSAPDYTIYRQDFTSSSGGLLAYVRSDLPQRRLTKFEHNSDMFESLCIEVKIGNTKTAILCVYKHPKMKIDEFKKCISDVSDTLMLTFDDFVIIGDMNCCPTKTSAIQDFCDTHGLTNLITSPTCHKGSISTLLDVILVTNPRRYCGSINMQCNISDFHNLIGTATRRYAPPQKPKRIFYRSYKHFSETDYCNDIMSAPFHVAYVFDDIDDTAWFTSALLSDIIDEHAPVKSKIVSKRSVPYMNTKLRKALYNRNMARNKFQKYGKEYWELNRYHRNNVVSIRKESMTIYFQKNCSKQDKHFWSTISPFFSDKKFRNGNTITIKDGDDTISDPVKVSEVFNDYFSTIASSIGFQDDIDSAENAIQKHSSHPSVKKITERYFNRLDTFHFKTVDSEHVSLLLKQIDPKKATGFDNIPGKLIRLAYRELSLPITILLNESIVKQSFPSIMKRAEVNPVYKKSDNLDRVNYRPVSVLTVLSKIFESILNEQLTGYFDSIFDDLLTAFRKDHSCHLLLIKFVEDWKSALDDHKAVGGLFMDLSKAFDCLPHSLLIAKLKAYGLDVSACSMISSYLSDRVQRVKVRNARSSWTSLRKGVPQGSVLGPLLFNVFMNDLFFFIEICKLYNYADDNSLSTCSDSIDGVISNLRHDGELSIAWFKSNGMEANPRKFQLLLCSARGFETHSIEIDRDVCIESEKSVVALGVEIDSDLRFAGHIRNCTNKASRQLHALSRIAKFLDVKTKCIVYNSFIRSNMSYCPLVWHFCGLQSNDKLEKNTGTGIKGNIWRLFLIIPRIIRRSTHILSIAL